MSENPLLNQAEFGTVLILPKEEKPIVWSKPNNVIRITISERLTFKVFLKRFWYWVSNPFYYILKGKIRY